MSLITLAKFGQINNNNINTLLSLAVLLYFKDERKHEQSLELPSLFILENIRHEQ